MALFKRAKTKRASMAAKKKMTGLDDEYRSTLLESEVKMRLSCGCIPCLISRASCCSINVIDKKIGYMLTIQPINIIN